MLKLIKGGYKMGLFGSKGECSVCHKEVGFNHFKIADKQLLCSD